MFTQTIPFTNPHGGIVIGSGGKTIHAIQHRTGCIIQAKKPEPTQGRPLPFFLIQAPHEKALNLATIEIFRLINTSMMNSEKKLREEISDMASRQQHQELVIESLKTDLFNYGDPIETPASNDQTASVEKVKKQPVTHKKTCKKVTWGKNEVRTMSHQSNIPNSIFMSVDSSDEESSDDEEENENWLNKKWDTNPGHN